MDSSLFKTALCLNNDSKTVSYKFSNKFDGYLIGSYYTHYPPQPQIHFNNNAATYSLICADQMIFAQKSWGGGVKPGCVFYKVNIPSNTTLTVSSNSVTEAALWVAISK